MLDKKFIQEMDEYMRSGRMEEDFRWSAEGRREEMLEYLELLMDLGDLADQTATAIIFKGSALGMLSGVGAAEGAGQAE